MAQFWRVVSKENEILGKMERIVTKDTNSISYTVKRHSRAKRVHVHVTEEGNVVVTIPKRAALREADAAVTLHFDWAQSMRAKHLLLREHAISLPSYEESKNKARTYITERVDRYAALLGYSYTSISIRNQKTRWGSCSAGGTLSFSYKLLYLDPALCDYVIVHELCHLKEMNHSVRLWSLVATVLPNYQELRKQLYTQQVRLRG